MTTNTWGGYRPGSGRRPKSGVSGVSHHQREAISARYPIQIVLTTKPELGSLRKQSIHGVLRQCLAEGCDTGWFRICHYSVQKHGLRLIAEARDRVALGRGMQGLCVRFARSLNRMWSRNGSVFADRYATTVLKTPDQVRASLIYVLSPAPGGRERATTAPGDPYSSGAYFDGWADAARAAGEPAEPAPVAKPRTALLQSGWRKAGLIRVSERPAPG